MSSLREDSGSASVVQRIGTLQEDTRANWGKMNCAQMLAHCQKAFQLASGELPMKRAFIGRLIGGWAKKKFVIGESPFGHNAPTDPKFRVEDERDFEKEKARLTEMIARYHEQGVVAAGPHPFFGEMTSAEWDRLLWKHMDHHLRQFGA